MDPRSTLSAWKKLLLAQIDTRAEEVALAAGALHGGPPGDEQWEDLLDFFSLEWVDADGETLLEKSVSAGLLPPEAAILSAEVRTALWVVDDWSGQQVCLRDVASDEEIAVEAAGLGGELPKRMVLRARVVPVGGGWFFYGGPELYGQQGVIGRLDLLRQWREGPEPVLLGHLRELRALFQRQREEREAWVGWFKDDLVVFQDAEALGTALTAFASYLFNAHPFPSLGGATRAASSRTAKGSEPSIVRFTLGETLSGPGRPGAIYDRREGVHFFPALGELRDHLDGRGSFPEVFRDYLENPGISGLPLWRLGGEGRLARGLGGPGGEEQPVDVLLRPFGKERRRARPSVLPGFGDEI